jgi:hypothetical protein
MSWVIVAWDLTDDTYGNEKNCSVFHTSKATIRSFLLSYVLGQRETRIAKFLEPDD